MHHPDGDNELCRIESEEHMTDRQKISALMDYFGKTRDEAEAMLIDMGELETGWPD